MTTSTIIKSLLLLGLAASQAGSSQAAKPPETTTAGLRAGGNGHEKKEQREHKRQSVIRRLYGPENGEVRKHVRLLEENSERSRTGFLGDIEHEVPYENHPYQKAYHSRKRERRGLQDTEFIETNNNNNAGGEGVTGGVITTTAVGDETGGTDLYRPMRIRFETQALDDTRDASNAAKIDFIKTQILPQ